RHTRFSRDWSSDVCSSDLIRAHQHQRAGGWASRHQIIGNVLDRKRSRQLLAATRDVNKSAAKPLKGGETTRGHRCQRVYTQPNQYKTLTQHIVTGTHLAASSADPALRKPTPRAPGRAPAFHEQPTAKCIRRLDFQFLKIAP